MYIQDQFKLKSIFVLYFKTKMFLVPFPYSTASIISILKIELEIRSAAWPPARDEEKMNEILSTPARWMTSRNAAKKKKGFVRSNHANTCCFLHAGKEREVSLTHRDGG